MKILNNSAVIILILFFLFSCDHGISPTKTEKDNDLLAVKSCFYECANQYPGNHAKRADGQEYCGLIEIQFERAQRKTP